MSLLKSTELQEPEYHTVRFEGLVDIFENNVKSIIKLRNRFSKQLHKLEKGESIEVKEWKIVDFDDHYKTI